MLSVFATRSTTESFLKLSYCKPVKIKFWHLTLLKVGRESSLKFVEKDTIRTFFVAKNVLKKKATYTTNIACIPEMKVLLKEAFCGVFKTNVTRYMVQLIKKSSYEKLLESLPLLY